jgi:hypothetical protein
VSGSNTADVTATTDARVLSGAFLLPGGKVYQIQAQCIGSTTEFGVVRSAAMMGG